MDAKNATSPYSLTVDELAQICDFDRRTEPSLLEDLKTKFGGLATIAKDLKTDLTNGIALKSKYREHHRQKRPNDMPSKMNVNSVNDMSVFDEDNRIMFFGENIIPPPRSETILEIVWGTIVEDPILKILIFGAIVVLALGSATCPSNGWTEGLAIVVAVFIVLSVTAGNDWSKDRKFKKIMLLQTDKRCRVIRGGIKTEMSSWDVLVGDLVEVVVGDEIPADGIFVSGNRLVVDESPLTGESVPCTKDTNAPFMFSGCQVSEGSGLMLITSVGLRSSGGKIQELLNESQDEETPLQEKLKVVAILIGKVGVAAGIVTFLGLLFRWAMLLINNEAVPQGTCDSSPSSGTSTLARLASIAEDFVVAITIVVVAVPEGLPLAVTLALSLSMFKMMRDKCFVRHLDASETMGQATTICTDKTGTLTYNRMSAVRVLVGDHIYKGEGSGDRDAIPFSQKTFSTPLKSLICEGICINSNCFIKNEDQLEIHHTQPQFVGSASEGALLILSRKLGVNYKTVRESIRVTENGVWSFSADRKRMSTLIVKPDKKYRLYTKGAAEVVLATCTHNIDPKTMDIVPIKAQDIAMIQKTIKAWSSEGLRLLALAYRDNVDLEKIQTEDDPEHDLVFIALIAIKDPIRKEIPGAVSECQRAGLFVRMVTGDNILTATKIAKECGIFHSDGIALEGPVFRTMSTEEKIAILPRLQVLARCSPNDKFELVSLLREQGEVVAVTGDGTNDAPALKEADVGFSMGNSGTQIALNASDIVLMDDNFASIVQAIRWGRNVLNTIRKFLQFQLGINLAAVTLTFAGSVSTGQSPLSTVQLLWINLIMDSFGALALASDDPDENILDQLPQKRSESIISSSMTEYIIGQTVLQVITMLLLLFMSDTWIPIDHSFHGIDNLTGTPTKRTRTIVFTSFILIQVTNLITARQLNSELNVFNGFFKNRLFLTILGVIIIVQVLAVVVGGYLFNTTQLDITEWLVCIGVALINLPYVFCVRFLSGMYHSWKERKADGRIADLKQNRLEHYANNGKIKTSAYDILDDDANSNHKVSDMERGIVSRNSVNKGSNGWKQGHNDSTDLPQLQRPPSIVEMMRKIKKDTPMPLKTRSQSSLGSSSSMASRK